MKSIFKIAVNKRFIEVSKLLVRSKKIKTQGLFCETIGIHPQIITDIRNDKRSVTIEMLSNMFHHFNVNPVYIIEGIGPMFLYISPNLKDKDLDTTDEDSSLKQVAEPLGKFKIVPKDAQGKIAELESILLNASILLSQIKDQVQTKE